jgi:phytoene dehydrogenase-like protein
MGEIDGAFRAWGFQKGGTGGISQAIGTSAQSFGAELRLDAPVAGVIVRKGRARGVVLGNGDEIIAPTVVSSLDPRRTFADLLEPGQLPDDLLTALGKYRYRGSSGKVNLALDGEPEFTCLGGDRRALRGAISISPGIDYLERAYDDAKYGSISRQPYMDIVIPSMIDPDMAPPGKHVMSIFVQYAPYDLAGGWDDARREEFGNTVISTLARYAPNLPSLVLARQVLTPEDIERTTGLSEGNIFQGELSLSQLFFLRPAAGWARYRTPVRGYWQCGSGTHPGGGIMGAPGRLAALEILRSLR